MTALIVVVGYLAVGVGLARLWLFKAERQGRSRSRKDREDLQMEMLFLFIGWPLGVPIYLLVQAVRFALYPRRLR